jgi:hypothetical protein
VKFSIKFFFKVTVLFLLVLTAFVSGLLDSLCVVGLADDDVPSKIATAEDALQRAFVAVLEAENAGANVSALLVKLDVAGKNLTEAEMDYKSGRLVEALSKAEGCSALANGVVDEALILKSSALINARSAEWQTFAFSGVGVFVYLVVLASVWMLLKRSYVRKLLGLRPEVGSDVEA